jgi:hypothetical protein
MTNLLEKREWNSCDIVVGKRVRRHSYRRWLKLFKRRYERHRARRTPECDPCYGRYAGYEY